MSFFSCVQRFISFGPCLRRAQPEHFLHHTKAPAFWVHSPHHVVPSQSAPLPIFPTGDGSPSPTILGTHISPAFFIFLLLLPHLMQRYLLAAVSCPGPVLPLICAISPPSILAPFLACSFAFSQPSAKNVSLLRPRPPAVFLLDGICAPPPDQNPRVGVLRFWATALPFSSLQPINDTFVVNMGRGGTDSPFIETHEGRQRCSLDGALHLKLCIQSSVHPMHWLHFLFVIDLHY